MLDAATANNWHLRLSPSTISFVSRNFSVQDVNRQDGDVSIYVLHIHCTIVPLCTKCSLVGTIDRSFDARVLPYWKYFGSVLFVGETAHFLPLSLPTVQKQRRNLPLQCELLHLALAQATHLFIFVILCPSQSVTNFPLHSSFNHTLFVKLLNLAFTSN